MMETAIRNFASQFAWKPDMQNKKAFKPRKKFVVCGMGGSHLPADILRAWRPELDLVDWRNYGLPPIGDLKDRLVILSSYSGNTEEVIEAFEKCRKQKLSMAAITIGGRLLELARKHGAPYLQMPNTGIQPRSATGLAVRGHLALTRDTRGLLVSGRLAKTLKPEAYQRQGRSLAERLTGRVPVIYASAENEILARNWKIKMNETAKIPAFFNVVPEMNHNEMTGFDVVTATRSLAKNFHFLMLEDDKDHPRNRMRMRVLRRLFEERALPVDTVRIEGRDPFERIFSSSIIGDWSALYLAGYYGTESEEVPMVEEFKKLIA